VALLWGRDKPGTRAVRGLQGLVCTKTPSLLKGRRRGLEHEILQLFSFSSACHPRFVDTGLRT